MRAALGASGLASRIAEKIEALDTPEGVTALLSGMKIVEALKI
jgi:hypothetical protein